MCDPLPEIDAAATDAKAGTWPWLAVTGITLLAALLRCYRVTTFSLWNDELGTIIDCTTYGGDFWKYPLGYLVVRPGLMLFGECELGARFVPVVMGVLAVPVLYRVARPMVGVGGALCASLFLAFSSFHIYHSQNARYYAVLFVLSTLLLGCLHRGFERGRRLDLLLAMLLLVVMFWTHWGSAALIPGVIGYMALCALLRMRPLGMTRPMVAGVLAAVALLAIGAIPLAGYFYRFWAFGEFSLRNGVLFCAKMADRIDVAVCGVCALAIWQLLARRDRRGFFLASMGVLPVAALAVMVSFSQGGSRLGFVALPPFLMLAGWVCAERIRSAVPGQKLLGAAALAAVLCSLAANDYLYHFHQHGQRPRWREASRFVRDTAKPNDRFVATLPEVFQFYTDLPVRRLSDLHSVARLDLQRRRPGAVWFAVGYVGINAPLPQQKKWLNEHCNLVAEFPLHVRILDYTIRIYRTRPPS